MKIICVIPARYKSSRFPGKPLVDINGKPMVWWTYNQALKVKDFNSVYIATEDKRIENVCHEYGMNVVMTADNHATGTDRVGEVAEKIKADLYINVQGDEPLIEPEVIAEVIKPFYANPDLQVSNLMSKIDNPIDALNWTVPKVITNRDNIGIFITRSAAPFPKGRLDYSFYKQMGIYGFTPEALHFFCNSPRGKQEEIEDVELLRFIESYYKIQFVEVKTNSVAVDTPEDLEKVNKIFKNNN